MQHAVCTQHACAAASSVQALAAALAVGGSPHRHGPPTQAEYTVSLEGEALHTRLKVTNTGDKPFAFTASLHSYFAVRTRLPRGMGWGGGGGG